MNVRNVEVFCDIATLRSFSAVARLREVSQPAVSQAIQLLEEELGVVLVDRSKRPVELTFAGRIYFDRCQKWLDEYREIVDAVRENSDNIAGKVRVASIYSVGLLQMSSYVKRLREEYPGIELMLDYAQPDQIYSRLLRDEIELGILSFPRDGGEFGCIPWQDQEMVVAVSPNHPLSGRESIAVAELAGADFVAFTADLTIRRKTEKLLRDHGVSVTVVHQFDNVETIKRAVEIDLGLSILPLPTMRRELEFGTLEAIPIADARFVRPLGIVHKRHKHLSRAAEKFVEFLHEPPVGESQPIGSSAGAGIR